jgi:hypothetical protein
MIHNQKMMTYNGAQENDPKVLEWIADHQSEHGQMAAYWFGHIRNLGDEILDLLHDGYPTACIGRYPFAYVGAFKAHANLGFFYGVDLPDPHGLLEGSGKRLRHVKLKPGKPGDHHALETLIRAAYADIQHRLAAHHGP